MIESSGNSRTNRDSAHIAPVHCERPLWKRSGARCGKRPIAGAACARPLACSRIWNRDTLLQWLRRDSLSRRGGFFQARNNLTADLIEARSALSKRWLASCAVRIAERAGELSQPFADESNTLARRVEALLFLARRMRQAKGRTIWDSALHRMISSGCGKICMTN